MRRGSARVWAIAAVLTAVGVIAACSGALDSDQRARPAARAPAAKAPAVRKPARLVRWKGPVEHLFFHTLVTDPKLAFKDDARGRGLRDYFVTVREFRSILERLYANGWTLVDLRRAARGTVRVPRGRRPFVLSEDDVNYYDYTRERGVGWRLVLDAAGNVAVEERTPSGLRVTGNDLIPIVDAFVARHPDFSAQGAKGVLALTGYEGLFGERIQEGGSGGSAALQRARALAQRLRQTGWTFASHTYGHIDLARRSAEDVLLDTNRWQRLAGPVLGNVDVLIYPYGASPAAGSATARILREAGYSIQCDIDSSPGLFQRDGATIMSRRHIDGIALYDQASQLRRFFRAESVRETRGRT